jgi:aryl-phospho-beta-D-glucosidase BglC (GH1 family)
MRRGTETMLVRRILVPAAAAVALLLTVGSVRADDAIPVVPQWSRFEATWVPDMTPVNPFDPRVIDVRAEFDRAGGAPPVEVPAFWYQAYERALVHRREQLTPVGDPAFRVRFTPTRTGRWRWRWVIRTGGVTTTGPWQRFRVTRVRAHGFLRISRRDPRRLAFDDRSPYFAVGENTGWYDAGGTFDYDQWFADLAAQGANYARVWMPSRAFGLEWSDTGLGDYTARLGRAWQLDYVFDLAEQQGIYVMLDLLNHGPFSLLFNSEWASNPYNAANGGPLATPAEFFTNPEARRLFEQRLRYIVARWGWSTHLLAWELWNEVDLTAGYSSPAVTAWHADMAALLRTLDANHHLVTTSHAIFLNDPSVWSGGGLDFTQIHFYANVFPAMRDIARTITQLTADRLEATSVPVLFAEFGVDAGAAATEASDPDGIGIHDGLWAGVVSGGVGTGMTWWWDAIIAAQPGRYYPMFGAVAGFVDGIRWDRERFAPAGASVDSATRPVIAYGLAGRRSLLLWLKDDDFQWYSPDAATIADATLAVDGRWCGRWYDPWAGTWGAEVQFRDDVPVPPFSRDLALLAHHC